MPIVLLSGDVQMPIHETAVQFKCSMLLWFLCRRMSRGHDLHDTTLLFCKHISLVNTNRFHTLSWFYLFFGHVRIASDAVTAVQPHITIRRRSCVFMFVVTVTTRSNKCTTFTSQTQLQLSIVAASGICIVIGTVPRAVASQNAIALYNGRAVL